MMFYCLFLLNCIFKILSLKHIPLTEEHFLSSATNRSAIVVFVPTIVFFIPAIVIYHPTIFVMDVSAIYVMTDEEETFSVAMMSTVAMASFVTSSSCAASLSFIAMCSAGSCCSCCCGCSCCS